MKTLLTAFLLSISLSSVAGSNGAYLLNCTSQSLRTHIFMQLNDYDFDKTALQPQRLVLSVMGHMSIFDENIEFGPSYKTINKNGQLEIYSTDNDRSHVFKVDFRKRSTAQVVIEKAINPRNGKSFSGLTLECKKSHEL